MGGFGGRADVQADRIAVVTKETGEEGTVELRADSLNALGVESLFLGGTRSDDADGTNLDVTASEVSIDAGAEVELPELLLAARDTVRVESGASITAQGSVEQGASGLHTDGDGALLVASAGDSTTFVRSGRDRRERCPRRGIRAHGSTRRCAAARRQPGHAPRRRAAGRGRAHARGKPHRPSAIPTRTSTASRSPSRRWRRSGSIR
jgi:hypothetical protein